MQILEDEHARALVGEALEEDAPGREEVVALPAGVLLEPEQVGEARLDPACARPRRGRTPRAPHAAWLLPPARPPPRRCLRARAPSRRAPSRRRPRRRPGTALGATRSSSTSPSTYLKNSQSRRDLPMPATPVTETSRVRCSSAVEWNSSLIEPELAVAAHERRFQTHGFERARAARGHLPGAPEVHRLRLALHRVRAAVLVRDRRLRRAARGFPDEHRAGLCRRLDARGRVDEVARDHALALGADGDRRLPGEHARARAQLADADLRAKRLHGLDKLERGPDRALGVVLVRSGSAPDGHDGVADELLDGAAVALDRRARRVEVAGQELPGLLGVAGLGGSGEADEVGEEHRDEAALGGRSARWRGGGARRRRPDSSGQRGSALAAEPLARRVLGAAGGTAGRRKPSAAFAAELLPGRILGAAGRASHAVTVARPARDSSWSIRPRRRLQPSCSAVARASARSGAASSARSSEISESA